MHGASKVNSEAAIGKEKSAVGMVSRDWDRKEVEIKVGRNLAEYYSYLARLR